MSQVTFKPGRSMCAEEIAAALAAGRFDRKTPVKKIASKQCSTDGACVRLSMGTRTSRTLIRY